MIGHSYLDKTHLRGPVTKRASPSITWSLTEREKRCGEDNAAHPSLREQKRDVGVVDHFLCCVFVWRDVFCADVLRLVILVKRSFRS